MPCWTLVEQTVELNNTDRDVLKQALQGLGFDNFHEGDQYALNVGAQFSCDNFGAKDIRMSGFSVRIMLNGQINVSARPGHTAEQVKALGDSLKREVCIVALERSAEVTGFEVVWTDRAAMQGELVKSNMESQMMTGMSGGMGW